MIGDMRQDVLKRSFEVLHLVEAALELPLYIVHDVVVSLGDIRDALLVGLQSLTVPDFSGLNRLEEVSHIGSHRETSNLVELNESNRFRRDTGCFLLNEGNVPAHV
jgi:hypothetical protein